MPLCNTRSCRVWSSWRRATRLGWTTSASPTTPATLSGRWWPCTTSSSRRRDPPSPSWCPEMHEWCDWCHLLHIIHLTLMWTRGVMIPAQDPYLESDFQLYGNSGFRLGTSKKWNVTPIQVLWFWPWIQIQSQIFIHLAILDSESDPVKSGIITPLMWINKPAGRAGSISLGGRWRMTGWGCSRCGRRSTGCWARLPWRRGAPPGWQFNRNKIGSIFGLKNGLRFHFDSMICLNYPTFYIYGNLKPKLKPFFKPKLKPNCFLLNFLPASWGRPLTWRCCSCPSCGPWPCRRPSWPCPSPPRPRSPRQSRCALCGPAARERSEFLLLVFPPLPIFRRCNLFSFVLG